MSDCLKYPELSIIVMYKQLVIGCGFVTPEGYIPALFVHPEWHEPSMIQFMLYSLVQSCPAQDICVHICVHNLFVVDNVLPLRECGFVAESIHVGFFDKFLKPNIASSSLPERIIPSGGFVETDSYDGLCMKLHKKAL